MPTMSLDSVKVLPMQSRSAMTLAEIRDAMSEMKPSLDGFKGGWASTNNYESNLRRAGVAPPESVPTIESATNVLPEMLKARFYYWDPAPSGLSDQVEHDPLSTRRLNAIDVIITEPAPGRVGLLFSTRTRAYLNRNFGVIACLERILQSKDVTIKVDRGESHLRLHDEEIFLWLAVQRRDKPQLAEDLRVDMISGISSRDGASRTADLRYGVDFERSNFLTAVAEVDTLGPIDLNFVHYVGGDNHSYEVRLHVDGGFEIRKSGLHFPDQLNREDMMMETSLFLAYSLIPRLNQLYIDDAPNWKNQRVEVIESAMTALEERYKTLKTLLQHQHDEESH
ncbi:hypothetical protein SB659_10505 [Arthrobacter sp. SIMBA_036]|uniref:hypothetical protein n=1 Tax=Arthrobacter sp. SIMBA_036 TaxID=3085778 RepID=UPI00397DD226